MAMNQYQDAQSYLEIDLNLLFDGIWDLGQ
jgi:hypothetical protein